MIRHILKIIWNERRTNSWMVLEFVLVFTVLWFCADFLYDTCKQYLQPTGYDIAHTYRVRFNTKKDMHDSREEDEKEAGDTNYEVAMLIVDRIKKYPGVEYVSLSESAVPYGFSMSGTQYLINNDTVGIQFSIKKITASFFDVFKIKPVSGRLFTDDSSTDEIIISSMDGVFLGNHPMNEVISLKRGNEEEQQKDIPVIGIVNTPKNFILGTLENSIFNILKKEEVNIAENQVILRIKPEADVNFSRKFMNDMREQLNVGEFYLTSIESGETITKDASKSFDSLNNVKSTLSITGFLLLNIFMGIVGTFWFLTQSRRSEIGLRLALGSSKRKVTGMIVNETLMILFLASIVATVICLNVSMTDFLESMGLPVVYRPKDAPANYVQLIINYCITFGTLAFISMAAVMYPAYQAAKTQPAEALKDE